MEAFKIGMVIAIDNTMNMLRIIMSLKHIEISLERRDKSILQTIKKSFQTHQSTTTIRTPI